MEENSGRNLYYLEKIDEFIRTEPKIIYWLLVKQFFWKPFRNNSLALFLWKINDLGIFNTVDFIRIFTPLESVEILI